MPELLQNGLMYFGSFALVLSVVVFVHEFGHFQVAKWRQVAIDTFSIGFGKKLFGWRDRRGVEWKVGMLPLGGYVKFADDADAFSTGPAEQIEDPIAKADARRRGLFHAQPLSTRAMVVAAGPLTNFVFAIGAFALAASIQGHDVTDYSRVAPRIGSVQQGAAAEAAGLRPGEVVRAADGVAIANWPAFQALIAHSPGRTLALTLVSENGERVVNVTPREVRRQGANGATETVGALGVTLGVRASERAVEPIGALDALRYGALATWTLVARTGDYMIGVFSGRNSGRDIAGPLGILNASGQVTAYAIDTSEGDILAAIGSVALALLGWAAMLSVAVGIVNLLPIPMLDGGHLLFYAIEALRGGKPMPAAAQEWAYRAGFAVMAGLFLFATWNDISRLLPGSQG